MEFRSARVLKKMSNKYDVTEMHTLISKHFNEIVPFKSVSERPSLVWQRDNASIFPAEVKAFSRALRVQIIRGYNDVVLNLSCSPQGPLESVVIRKFADFYMTRAESLPVVRKRPFDVFLWIYCLGAIQYFVSSYFKESRR
jgi:hypothetical protein